MRVYPQDAKGYFYESNVDRLPNQGLRGSFYARPGLFEFQLGHVGKPQRGIELFVGILPILKAVRFAALELWLTLFLAEGYWLAGEYDKGRQTAEELLKVAEPMGARFCIGHAHYLLGEMSLETDPAEAATRFQKSIALFQEIKAENALAMDCAGDGRLHKQQGNGGSRPASI